MAKSTKKLVTILIGIAAVVLVLYACKYFYDKKNSIVEGMSISFDPSVRSAIAGIGPISPDDDIEGYCGACQ